jgi:hypothetical protein
MWEGPLRPDCFSCNLGRGAKAPPTLLSLVVRIFFLVVVCALIAKLAQSLFAP